MKINLPMWITANFECIDVPLESANENDSMENGNKDRCRSANKMFVNKPVAVGYNSLKSSDHGNLNLGKEGYNKYFVEDCIEWFINDMMDSTLQSSTNANHLISSNI